MKSQKQLEQQQEYERIKAIRERVENGTSNFAERNYLKMYDKGKGKGKWKKPTY